MAAPYQKYHLGWPWTPRQVENLDDMLADIFKWLTDLSNTVAAIPSGGIVVTSTAPAGSRHSSQDGVDGEDGAPGAPGPSGIQGLTGVGIPGYNGEDGDEAQPFCLSGVAPLPGTKVYFVSDTSGGAVNRKLTFYNGLLVSET